MLNTDQLKIKKFDLVGKIRRNEFKKFNISSDMVRFILVYLVMDADNQWHSSILNSEVSNILRIPTDNIVKCLDIFAKKTKLIVRTGVEHNKEYNLFPLISAMEGK